MSIGRKAFLLAIGVLAPAGVVSADVTINQNMELSGGGSLAVFSSSGVIKTRVSGDKLRSENHMESKSNMLGGLMPDQDSTTINLLGEERVLTLFPKKQKYSEMSYEQMRAQLARAEAQMEELQQGGQGGALPVSEKECEWSDSTFEANKTGEKQRFANVKAEQHIITIQQTCTVPDSDQTCVMTWRMENWMAKRMPGDDEIQAFHRDMAEKMGMDEWAGRFGGASQGLMGMFNEGWDEAIEEVQTLKGYPVKTVMTMEIGGDECTAASGQPIAMDDIWGNALDAGIDSGANTAGYHAGNKVSREAAQAAGGGVGGSIAGSAVGSASGEVISGMLKHFGKKKKKAKPVVEAEPVENANPGSVVLFRISTELTAVNDDKIPAEQFEVPNDWEKTNR